jgi:hypothetical protein
VIDYATGSVVAATVLAQDAKAIAATNTPVLTSTNEICLQ